MPNAYFGVAYDIATITDNTRCNYCGTTSSTITAPDGQWCSDRCQQYDRQSETRLLTTTHTYGRNPRG